MAEESDIELLFTPTESYNSFGAGEKYHGPVGRAYTKRDMELPYIGRNIKPALAGNSMNDTYGPEVLIPSLMVFGVVPRMPLGRSALPDQEYRMQAVKVGRAEMEPIASEIRISRALYKKPPIATDKPVAAGMNIFVYREKDGQWVGPVMAKVVEGKAVYVRDRKFAPKPLTISTTKE